MSYLRLSILALSALAVLYPTDGCGAPDAKVSHRSLLQKKKGGNSGSAQDAVLAAFKGDIKTVKRVIKKLGVNAKTPEGFTPLHGGAQGGQTKIISFLLKGGAGLNAQASNGATPLYLAVQAGKLPAVSALLRAGANAELAITDTGSTPLMFAALHANTGITSALLKGKAIIDTVDVNGRTALHWAAVGFKNGKVMRILLKGGPTLDTRDIEGETALSVASFYGNLDAVQLLLKARADTTGTNNKGELPVDRACECKTQQLCTPQSKCTNAIKSKIVKMLRA